jgi:hypothetical protein
MGGSGGNGATCDFGSSFLRFCELRAEEPHIEHTVKAAKAASDIGRINS